MPWLDRLARFRGTRPEKPASDPGTDEIIAERLKELGVKDEPAAPVEPATPETLVKVEAAVVEPADAQPAGDEMAAAVESAAAWLAEDEPLTTVESATGEPADVDTAAAVESAAAWLSEDEPVTAAEPTGDQAANAEAAAEVESAAASRTEDEPAPAVDARADQAAADTTADAVEFSAERPLTEEPAPDRPEAQAPEAQAPDVQEPEVREPEGLKPDDEGPRTRENSPPLPVTADLATLPDSALEPRVQVEVGAITTVLIGIDVFDGEDPAHVLDLMTSLEELAAVIFRRGDVTYPAGPAEMLLVCPERTPEEVRDAIARLRRAAAHLGTLRAALFNLEGDPRDSLPELQAALAVCRATGLQLVDRTVFQGG